MRQTFSVIVSGILFLLMFFNTSNANELHKAAAIGDLLNVKKLIASGSNINEYAADPISKDNWPKGTPLHWASYYGRNGIVKYLIAKGSNVNAFTNAGDSKMIETPLLYAVSGNHKEIVQMLLEAGAYVEGANHEFYWPFELSLRKGNIEIAKRLFKYGASIDRYDFAGYTALHKAIGEKQRKSVEFLIEKGADVNYCDIECCVTPLFLGVMENDIEIAKLLLKNGADISIENCQNKSPLSYAKEHNYVEIIQLLNNYNINGNIVGTSIPVFKSQLLNKAYSYKYDMDWMLDSSSWLKSSRKKVYSVARINDSNKKTAWVEGVNGNGVGEYISFKYPEILKHTYKTYKKIAINGLATINGYAKNTKVWANNARVKEIRIDVNDVPKFTIKLIDSMTIQEVKFYSLIIKPKDIIKLTIIDVYPGKLYQDTAISELDILIRDVKIN